MFVELQPHLAYLCLHNNNNFPSIVLSSLPEKGYSFVGTDLEEKRRKNQRWAREVRCDYFENEGARRLRLFQ